jgi:hypothetical protein
VPDQPNPVNDLTPAQRRGAAQQFADNPDFLTITFTDRVDDGAVRSVTVTRQQVADWSEPATGLTREPGRGGFAVPPRWLM